MTLPLERNLLSSPRLAKRRAATAQYPLPAALYALLIALQRGISKGAKPRDAIIGILAVPCEASVQLSELVQAGSSARCQRRVGGRPKVNRANDPDAEGMRQLDVEGQSCGEIVTDLNRSKAEVHRVCMTLGRSAM